MIVLSRRFKPWILVTLVALGALAAAACGGGETKPAAPSAPQPPAQPPAQPAPPPAAQPAPAPAKPAWEAEWESLIKAAKAEGRVVVTVPPGQAYRDWVGEFEKKYGVTGEVSNLTGPDFTNRIVPERQAGKYLWDVAVGGSSSMIKEKNQGVYDPLLPALIPPDVYADNKWLNGFEARWMDKEKKYLTSFIWNFSATTFINRKCPGTENLTKHEQLLEPKWKGKMAAFDFRIGGKPAGDAGQWIANGHGDFYRRLLQQDLAITRDYRQLTEWVVRCQYPVGFGVLEFILAEFQKEGLGTQVEYLDPGSLLGGKVSQTKTIGLINRAPHPNAAKLFVNWALSAEGQRLHSRYIGDCSARLDIQNEPCPRSTAPKGVDFLGLPPSIHPEERQHFADRANEIAKEILGRS